MKHGHRQFLDPHQVKSSSGLNREAWPLRINHLREDRTGPNPALVEWLPIPGYECLYEVSCEGAVRSLCRNQPRILAPWFNHDGYPKVHLCKDGNRVHHFVHRLVALAFHGDRQNALHNEVAHLDNDRANARADNLKWVSKVENHSHKRIHGTHRRGHFILSLEQVEKIRLREGTAKELGGRYGVSSRAIYDIWQGKRWTAESIGGKA